MKIPLARLLVVPLALLLASCGLASSVGRMLVLADRPWWDAAGGDAALRRPLSVAALRRGLLPRFVVVPVHEDAGQRLDAQLAAGGWKVVVVGPLLALEAAGIARRYPRVTFILVDGPVGAAGAPGNTITLVFDRRQAFAEAGADAAREGPVGIVAVSSRPSTPDLAAFVEGARGVSGSDPAVVTIEEPADVGRIEEAVVKLRAAGVKVVLPWLAGDGAAFLATLARHGCAAVVEDWAASHASPAQVLVSIDEAVADGVAECIAGIGSRGVVQGRVLVSRGGAPMESGQ